MKVINLFGGPCRGKSTTAAGLFYNFKISGYNCELVTEYAKDMTFEERNNILKDQIYILAKQNRRLERLRDKVDLTITDSPLILGLIYAPNDYYEYYTPLTHEVFNSYENINFYLTSTKGLGYQSSGRSQTEMEAKIIDNKVKELLDSNKLPYYTIDIDPENDHNNLNQIIDIITKEI